MKTNSEPLEYYLALDYPLSLEREEGGWLGYYPDLGRGTITTVGDTIQEVVAELDEMRTSTLTYWYEKGLPIPEPRAGESYSGNFVLRLPKELHAELAQAAKRNGTSLNQYCQYLLAARNRQAG